MRTQHAILLPNAITSIVIGKSGTDIGGVIYYLCKRGSLRGIGKIIVDLVNPISTPISSFSFSDCGITGISCSEDANNNISLSFTVDNSSENPVLVDWIFLKQTRQFTT